MKQGQSTDEALRAIAAECVNSMGDVFYEPDEWGDSRWGLDGDEDDGKTANQRLLESVKDGVYNALVKAWELGATRRGEGRATSDLCSLAERGEMKWNLLPSALQEKIWEGEGNSRKKGAVEGANALERAAKILAESADMTPEEAVAYIAVVVLDRFTLRRDGL